MHSLISAVVINDMLIHSETVLLALGGRSLGNDAVYELSHDH